MFGTLQGRLPQELTLAGIDDIEEANRYIREIYVLLHNEQFAKASTIAQPPQIAESAFVAVNYPASLTDILCVEQERVVPHDNAVAYEGRPRGVLRPASPRALQRARRRDCSAPTTSSVTPCSAPSRRGLETMAPGASARGRPSLTAAARGVTPPRRIGTKKRPSGRTRKLTRKKHIQGPATSA
jgi:hypothetical protein